MKSEFFISFVRHIRYIPKKYAFDYRFFWTKFNLEELDELHQKSVFFSYNKFNLVSFYDRDHIHLGKKTLKENIQLYLKENNIDDEILKIELLTNPRILGYAFNPVSFYFIQTKSTPYLIIEIGNTFKEQKPYLVRPENLKDGLWEFKTNKHFYISPFTSVENTLNFKIKRTENNIAITIDDFNKKNDLEIQAIYTGRSETWNNANLLKLFFLYPLITFRIIFSIHWHALKLFLLKIPYWKKSDDVHLQTDLYSWKDQAFRKKL